MYIWFNGTHWMRATVTPLSDHGIRLESCQPDAKGEPSEQWEELSDEPTVQLEYMAEGFRHMAARIAAEIEALEH